MKAQYDFHDKDQLCAGLATIENLELPKEIRTFEKALNYVFGCSDETVRKKKKEFGLELSYARARDSFADYQIEIAQDDLMDDDRILSRIDDNGRIDPSWVALHSKRLEGLLKKKHGNKIEQTNTNINIDATAKADEIIDKLGGDDAARELLARLVQ